MERRRATSRSQLRRRRRRAGVAAGVVAALAFLSGLTASRGGPAVADADPPPLLVPAIDPDGERWREGVASRFDDYGEPLACGGTLAPDQLGVASRTLPCGTVVTFAYRGRIVALPVIDRGPYVAGRQWDLTGAAARALHFPGLGPIGWRL